MKITMKFTFLFIALPLIAFNTLALAQIPNYVPQNGLVGWWPFNGNANDESGNGNHGIVYGATGALDRWNLPSAYKFIVNSGATQRIVVPSPTFPNVNAFSVSSWVFLDSVPFITPANGGAIMSTCATTTDNFVQFAQKGQFDTAFHTSNYCGQVLSSYNQWYHLVVTYDGTVLKQYLNDSLVFQEAKNIILGSAGQDWTFGVVFFPQAPSQFQFQSPFHGIMDDIGFWSRELSQQEISLLFDWCQLINNQPQNQTVGVTGTANFSIISSDSSATYQWQTDLGVGFQNLNSVGQYSETTNDTLIVSNVTMSNNNQQFRCIITSGSCSDTSNVGMLFVDNSMTLEDQSDKSIKIYPNPAQTDFTIEVPDFVVGEKFVVLDNFGRVILKDEIKSTNQQISIQHLSKGTYVITVGNQFNQILVLN